MKKPLIAVPVYRSTADYDLIGRVLAERMKRHREAVLASVEVRWAR